MPGAQGSDLSETGFLQAEGTAGRSNARGTRVPEPGRESVEGGVK